MQTKKQTELSKVDVKQLDINHRTSHLRNLQSLPQWDQSKIKKSRIWAFSSNEKKVCRGKVQISIKEQVQRKELRWAVGWRLDRVVVKKRILSIRYRYCMCIPCNRQEWVHVDLLDRQMMVAKSVCLRLAKAFKLTKHKTCLNRRSRPEII